MQLFLYSQFDFWYDIFQKGIIQMDIQQLKYYLALCREENFTEAGFACNISQSSLSKQIKKLEKELDVTLIRRNTRKFEITKEGQIVREYADEIIRLNEDMLKKLHSSSEIRIGSMPVLAPYHLSVHLEEFHRLHPNIRLSLDEHPADRILADIDSYDFLILRSLLVADEKKYISQILYDDVLCAVVYDTHPLAGRTSVYLNELKDETFIFPEKNSGGYEAFYESCKKAGFEPNIQYNFPQTNTVFSFVREKAGVTVSFQKVCLSCDCSGLSVIPLKDDFHYPIALIYPRSRKLSEVQKAFFNFMKKAVCNSL